MGPECDQNDPEEDRVTPNIENIAARICVIARALPAAAIKNICGIWLPPLDYRWPNHRV